jgi:hypothetical protein
LIGFYAVSTDRTGKILKAAEPTSFNTTWYGTAFLAEGFAEYHRMCGDEKALSLAVEALKGFQQISDGK